MVLACLLDTGGRLRTTVLRALTRQLVDNVSRAECLSAAIHRAGHSLVNTF